MFSLGAASWGLATLSLAVTFGLAAGAIRIRGIRLGVSAVLFSALLFGQLGLAVDAKVLEFLRDFALIIFVYAIGLQVGPGFVASLRQEGLRLNILSLAVLVLGAAMTGVLVWLAKLPHGSAAGLYAGAFTTTPGLAAGQDALRLSRAAGADGGATAVATASLAYTVAYPFGVLGPILVIVALRKVFNVRIGDELAKFIELEQAKRPPIEFIDVEVTRPNHADIALKEHPLLREHGITFSRLLRADAVTVPTGDTTVQVGDVYRAVGPRTGLNEVVAAMGQRSKINLSTSTGDIHRREFVVTRTQVLRRTLRELDFIRRAGVTLSRVNRSGIELAPLASLRLVFGDRVVAVGPEAGLKIVEDELGNCMDALNRPQLIPIFLGIVLGVVIGSVPLAIPGLNVKL